MASAHHLIIGGQRSGKSRQAERMGLAWLKQASHHRVTVVATALALDDEMRLRIERHRQERPAGFDMVESPMDLGEALRQQASPDRLLIVDCLTLWLVNALVPREARCAELRDDLLAALSTVSSPVVLVSNEIGWGVIPMGPEVRQFVDELGRLNQAVAQCCANITLMAAGQPWTKPVQVWNE